MQNKKKFKGRRRGPVKKRAPTTKVLAKRIKKIEDEIEVKYIDEYNGGAPSTLNASGTAFTLNNFGQSDTINGRTGNKVYVTSVQLKYLISLDSTRINTTAVRILLVIDKAHNGNASSFDAVFLGPTGVLDNTVTTTLPSMMPRAYEMLYRYKVIYDKVHYIHPDGINVAATSVIGKSIYTRKTFKLGRTVVYDGNGTNVADLLKNAISLLCFADSGGPGFIYSSRIYFKDA